MGNVRLAIVCPGQAGQRRDMLDNLFVDHDLYDLRCAASDILGKDVEAWWRDLGEDAIFVSAHAQFAIALHQIAAWTRISRLVSQVSLVAGYSIGELSAYHVAGAIDGRTTLGLVQQRARLMDRAAAGLGGVGGCMLLWRGRCSPDELAARDRIMASSGIDTAIIRSRSEQVLAGPAHMIDSLLANPAITNPNHVRLAITVPSHSRYLMPAVEPFRAALRKSGLAAPAVPVLAGIDAMRVRTREQAVDTLSRQIATTVRWDRCMATLAESGIDTVIELGPGNDLSRLIETEHPRIAARSVDEFRDWRSLGDWLDSR
ncbi:MAG: acyltransferase domain-containing protein [Deltaproteobacteria bacterium]|nr:acyltransferase domain-containing protein [Deltaproteobacteria bacterium]